MLLFFFIFFSLRVQSHSRTECIHRMQIWRTTRSSPGTSRDELHESEVSQSSMFCFESASPENSCFVVALFCFIPLCLRVPVFLNATRRDRNLPSFTSRENSGSM